ncbi:hypothetical protein V6N11_001960 [Hibiscus sabdariffa]|uniref:GAG-pre-integrase domain-containing protein n=1 Tax=Hibiscus sabdariffa TaxID=183260 RepID=A0ABR2QTT9_9ROSI
MQRKTISPYDITSSDNLGSKGRGGVEVNVVQASTTEVMGNDIISDSDKTAITGLSNEQWETLRTLLNGAKMGTNEKMTGCLECLSDVRDVIGCSDRTSGMLIGAGEQRGGLYFFRTMVTTTAMKMSGQSSFDMWHKRLGHPSSKVVELIPNVVFCELEFPYMTNTGSNNLNGGNENGDVVVVPQENNDIVVETGSETMMK